MKRVHLVDMDRYTSCGRRTFEVDCITDVSGVTCKQCLKHVIGLAVLKQFECLVAMGRASVAQSQLNG